MTSINSAINRLSTSAGLLAYACNLLPLLSISVSTNFGVDSAKLAKNIRKRYETTRSINVTNMRKERTNPEKIPMPWDVENLALTYAYTETEYRDHVIEKDLVKQEKEPYCEKQT